MSGTLNEKLLLYKLQTTKDPEMFGQLYDIYVKRIYRFVFFKVSSREEAEDLTADVFLKAWHYVTEHKDIKSFSGLLYRIARNNIIDLYRSRAMQTESLPQGEQAEAIGDANKWYNDVVVKVENEQLLQSLKKLKQEYQEVVTLRYVDELEIDEIAEITGKGKIAVRVTLHRAINKLKELTEQK